MRETTTICGLQMSARQQQRHFGFPHSKYLNILDKSKQPNREKGKQWQKFGQKFLLKPAKPSSLNEIELSFEPGAKIASEKSVCFRFRRRRFCQVTT
jgi:hypothetical protein